MVSPYVSGSGLRHGTIDGNFLRFTVPYETNDAGGDLNFSGLLKGDHIADPGPIAESIRQFFN